MITVEIDELTNCLVDSKTGKEVETYVKRINRSAELKNYNKKTGWYVNWENLSKSNEIYGLYVKNVEEPQGLVALQNDPDSDAIYRNWIVANPQNNGKLVKEDNREKSYIGVGGHLFAIACNRSIELGHHGYVHGYAKNKELLNHYLKQIGAKYLGYRHPFQFAIDEENAIMLVRRYKYDLQV